MSHDHGQACRCLVDHDPEPLELHIHHIWPLAAGGPDTPPNRVWLCPTAHVNVHEILRMFMRSGPMTSYELGRALGRPVNRYQRRVAYLGWQAITNRAVPTEAP